MQQEHKLIDACGGAQQGTFIECSTACPSNPLSDTQQQPPTQMRHVEIGHKQRGQWVAHLPSPQRGGENVLIQPMSSVGVPEITSPSFIMQGHWQQVNNKTGEPTGQKINSCILIPMVFESTQCAIPTHAIPAPNANGACAAIDKFPINEVPDRNTGGASTAVDEFQTTQIFERFGKCQAVSQGLSCSPSGISALEELLALGSTLHLYF